VIEISKSTKPNGAKPELDSLGLIGINSDQTGRLSNDAVKFKDALETEPASLEAMFTNSSGFGQTVVDALDVFIDPLDGSIKDRKDSIDRTVASLEDQVDRWDERAASYEARLRRSFASFESAAGALQGTGQFLTSFFFS